MPPAIYYICFLPPKTGGELVNLQHVATLNQRGVRAVALVNADGPAGDVPPGLPLERLGPDRLFGPDDIIVIPEYYRDALRHFAGVACRRVINTQGPFLTFRGVDTIEELNGLGLEAGLSCSAFTAGMMRRMGAALDWQVVTPFVHPMFQPGAVKKLQVAYMPDKRPKEAPVVLALFRQLYPEFAHVPWVAIRNLSRRGCAAVLAESAVFASFSYLEGLGLPPLEAMASDALVCGFDGHGGAGYANPDNGWWVREGEHDDFAHAVAAALGAAAAQGEEAQRRRAAGRASAALYSQARFETELMGAWRAILGARWPEYQLAYPIHTGPA